MQKLVVCSIFGLALAIVGFNAVAQGTADYDALVRQANSQLQAGNNEQALSTANAAIRANTSRWEAYAVAGGALLNLKQYEEAADQFSKAIDYAPEAKKVGLRDLRKQCLLAESGPSPSPTPTPSPSPTSQAEIVLWKTIEHSTNSADFQAYLQQYPNGAFAPLARNHLQTLGSGQGAGMNITIKDPAEYNAYTSAIGRPTPAAKAAAIEQFLQQYPYSAVKGAMLEQLVGAYQQTQDTAKTYDAAKRLLQVDPNNLRALIFVVYVEKQQTNGDQAKLDEAAALAQRGQNATKPANMSDADFQKLKDLGAPIFLDAIAADAAARKDYESAVDAYTAELKSYNPAQTTSGPGLLATYSLGNAYTQGSRTPTNLKSGVWFLTRAAQYAPPAYKDQIEKAAEYWYNKYHGGMDGFDQVKQLAAANLFPPASY
jgi:tetratricopeptide (TPR) repeat protein